MKPAIVWQTDFGTDWAYVATMRGVVKQIDPALECVDITHHVEQFNPLAASAVLMYTEPFWPKGTIFVSVVDPGVGTARKASCALLNDGNYVITPDNGTLTHLFYNVGVKEIREIDESVNRYKGTESVSVFHGRDIFAFTAAKLASGQISFSEVGPQYDVNDIIREEKDFVRAEVTDSNIEGFVTNVADNFGSILFNVLSEDFVRVGYQHGDHVKVKITNNDTVVFEDEVLYHKSFGFVDKGKPIIYNSSSNYVSIGLNLANFRDTYGIKAGRDFKVELRKA